MKLIVVTALIATFALAAVRPAVAGPPPPAPAAPAPRAAVAAAPLLDVNRATREQLVGVPGIGERLAEAIIELRTKQGGFASLADLLAIRGIGENNLKRFAEHLTVAAAPPGPAAAAGERTR